MRGGRDLPGLAVCGSCAGETAADEPGLRELARQARLARYRGMEAAGYARLTVVDCLDQCGRGDVVVVRPAAGRSQAGAVWLAGATGEQALLELQGWLRDGGPGAAPLPTALAPLAIDPRRET